VEAEVLYDGERQFALRSEANIEEPGLATARCPSLAITVKGEGDLLFRARIEGADWVELWRGPVTKREVTRAGS
jgi:hypothetical protein